MSDDGEPAEPEVASVVAAASAAAGRRLSEPVVLSEGSGRSLVLRCRDHGRGGVIVKAYPRTADGAGSFAREAAGLQVAAGSGATPDFIAADAGFRTVVMSDLGSGAMLSDVMLAGSAAAAGRALTDWARACGRLSASAGQRRDQFESLRTRYLGDWPDETYASGLAGRVLRAADQVTLAGVPAPAGLDADLADVASVAAVPGPYPVFSPGDLCPDNVFIDGAGVRFFDFESAGFGSVFLDAAYIRMPFSTCWCVFRFPASLAAAAESAYRAEVSAVWPELADESVWQSGTRRAVACWTLSSMWWLLRRALAADAPLNPVAVASPRTRQLMRYRWQVLAGELESAGELPALAGLMRALLAATEHWQAAELPLYPALR